MVIMRKLLPIILSILLMAVFIVPNAYAEDAKEIKFGDIDTQGYAELDSHTPSYSFQLWHYSGGYWGNKTYGVKLMDTQVAEGIKLNWVIEYKHPVTINADLPAKVKEYLANGGSIDNILIKFELTNGLRDHQIFTGTPTYSINNKQITVSFEPKFAVKDKHLVDHPGMNVHVPIIPEGYGKMVYAVFTPGGTHLGASDETYINPEDIIDCDGNLRADKTYGYSHYGPIKYLPGGKIKIGDGTFANGGAVGLEYLFPIKATYYIPDQWWVDVLTTEPVEVPEDWKMDTHLVVGKVATDEGLDNLENKAQDLTYYQDGDKVNLDFTFWNPMDDCSIAPFEYAVMYWDYSGGWDAMTGKHKENYIYTGLTDRDIFPRGNAGELDYEYDINVNQYPFELTTGKQINENSEIMEPVFGNKVNPCKNDDLFMTLAIVADPDAVFSVQSVDPEDEKWISLLTNIMIVHVPVKVVQGIDIELMLPDDYPPIILNQGESYRVPVSLMVTRNDPFETQTQPIDVDLTYTSPAGTVTKQIVINPFPNDYYEEEINFTVNREGTYIVSGEAYPINVTDPDLSNNKDSTRIPVRIKESASKTDADDQTRVNLRS